MNGKSSFVMIRPMDTLIWTYFIAMEEGLKKDDKIIFDNDSGFIYTSLLFYLKYPPSDFQKKVIREPDDSEGFSKVKSFGKYEFRNIDWSTYYNKINKRILYVTTENKKPKQLSAVKVFNYPKRPIVFSVKQTIMQYPIEENAYVILEKK